MNILDYYQNIPLHIDPTAFTVGFFSIGWYSLMYIVAFGVVYGLLRYRIKYDRESSKFQNKLQTTNHELQTLIFDFLMYALSGVLIGGRLGYVLFYNLPYYLHNPLAIVSPYDFSTGALTGIYGMSYHGGLAAVLIATVIFVKKNKVNFWKFADFIVPAIPAGYFFGRIGNFLNLELYGRVTGSWVGMHFPLWTGAGPLLRYPSQLFEALLEGFLLFGILLTIRNKPKFGGGYFTAMYLIGYGIARIAAEFFREPDEQIGFILRYVTLGQILSLAMILAGGAIYFQRRRLDSIIK